MFLLPQDCLQAGHLEEEHHVSGISFPMRAHSTAVKTAIQLICKPLLPQNSPCPHSAFTVVDMQPPSSQGQVGSSKQQQ